MRFDAERLARLNDNPLYRTLGIRLESAGEGDAVSWLEPREAVCWPSPGQPHGGVLFTLLDTTMAFAAMTRGEDGGGCATVDASVQYIAPARRAPFCCRVWTLSGSARTVFVRAEIRDADEALVAAGQGTFRLFRPRA